MVGGIFFKFAKDVSGLYDTDEYAGLISTLYHARALDVQIITAISCFIKRYWKLSNNNIVRS